MRFSKKILETFIDLPKDWQELMEDVGLEVKSTDGDIINLELLANRGDHYCYLGLATEIIGRLGGKLKEKKPDPIVNASLFVNENKDKNVFKGEPELIKNGNFYKYKDTDYVFDIKTDKCLAYSLLPLALKKVQKSRETTDKYIKTMLPASGVNLILDIIDITNVVMLEHGQPAHIYDADKIKGLIHIRESKKGEKADLLFHEGLTELPAGTVVIADEEKILCIGGVIGCHGAEVDENTTNILLETALFDPVSIRKTERILLEKPTIAAMIFERGGNWYGPRDGAARGKRLLNLIGWEQSGDYQLMNSDVPIKIINLPGDFVRGELEIDISDDEIIDRLGRYGFKSSGDNKYTVPPWRVWDIKGEKADLIEELCRSIGYNNLPSKLPNAVMGSSPTNSEIRKSTIDSYMVNAGFYEVFTENMYSLKHAKLSPNKNHLSLENSVDGAYAYMKNNCIVQAAELVSKNLRVKNREIRAFEWGKIFPISKPEQNILWGVINGASESALTVKGLIENLLKSLNLNYKLEFLFKENDSSEEGLLMPKRMAWVICNDKVIGYFGEISPALLSEFDIKNDHPVYFAIDTDLLLSASVNNVKYNSPESIIASTRDISVTVPYGVFAGDVSEFILGKYKSKVANSEITDVFDKPKESIRNITFTLEFKTGHSADELNALIMDIMKSAGDFAKKQ